MDRVLISRTKIDRDVWQKLNTVSNQLGKTREEMMNIVLRKFVESYSVKLVKNPVKRGEESKDRNYFAKP